LIAASASDPYIFNDFATSYSNIRGRTQKTSVVSDRPNTKIIIVDGQSEHATYNGTAAYTANAASHQLNIYDGAIYDAIDPLLGCTNNAAGAFSSPVMRIADRLIAQGKATRVIMVPIAQAGTLWAQYEPAASNSLFTRIQAAVRRLAAIGLTPDKIIVGRGVSDGVAGTSAASVRSSINAWITGVRTLTSASIYIGKFTATGGSANATVQSGIASAISDNVANSVFAGYDADTNATVAGGYRLADQTHFSDTGLTLVGNGWADLIYP
jgi:hypothetical protein